MNFHSAVGEEAVEDHRGDQARRQVGKGRDEKLWISSNVHRSYAASLV